MYTNNKLSKAVRLAIAFSAASATAFTAQVIAADEEETVRVERIEVTGSRIRRTDLEQSVPITVIDRESIDASGEISVSDLIRSTTFNTAGSFRPQSGSAIQGISTVNMRGLGSARTLVLVDGRRLPKAPASGAAQDLNVVPLAAVERIEILSDGASAVYGSDAIGGVINIITRRDFEGAQVQYGQSRISLPSDGGDREEGSVLFGTSTDTTRVLGGFSWNNRDIIFHRANSSWMDIAPGTSIYGNNFTEGTGPGAHVGPWFSAPTSAAECTQTENFNYIAREGTIGQCVYDFTATNANEASTGNKGLFFKADHQINDDWTIFANASVANSSSFGRYAPSLNDPGSVLNADSVNNPSNPDSPLYRESVFDGSYRDGISPAFDGTGQRNMMYWHRFASLGDRDSYVDVQNRDVLVGVEGSIGDVFVDFGVRRNNSKSNDIGYNYLLRSAASDAVNITAEQAAAADVYYDLRDPLGSRYAGSPDLAEAYQTLLNGMNVTISRISEFDQREVFGSAAFDILDMDAGTIQGVFGFEYRKETYVDQYDALSEAGQVGGSSGNSAGGGRTVRAAYFEALIPITDDLEISTAVRWDDYSDYGSDVSPKVSFRYQPMTELVIRGSYGQGFRAPTLDQITAADSFGNPGTQDPATCLDLVGTVSPCSIQVRQLTRANPELESENSEQYSLGIAYQPTDWLNFAVDYWDISIDNQISLFGLNTLLTREASGQAIPAGVNIIRGGGCYTQEQVGAGNPLCGITGVNAGYANDGTFDTKGIDLNVRTTFNLAELGMLRQNLTISNTMSRKIDGGTNTIRNPGIPAYRASLSNVYSVHDFDFSWTMHAIGKQYNTFRDADGNRDGNIATWITHDLQVAYSTPWDGRFVIGAQNAFEKEPQLFTNAQSRGTRDYNFDLYHAYGRIMYFRYTQNF
jgi:iron complex outermembrane receptor protein